MKIHGLNLDQSPLIAQDKSLSYAENIAIGEGNQSYVNEDGFIDKLDINQYLHENVFPNISNDISNSRPLHIIGTIPTNIGVVLFCVSKATEDDIYQHDLYFIIYITTNSDIPCIEKILYTIDQSNGLNFSITRPIQGDYIYNYKNELIVTFTEGISNEANETRIINISDPTYCSNQILNHIYEITDVSQLNLIPNVEYPTLNVNIDEGGNLRTGAYQIAIAYKLFDGSYTNYSILSVPTICCGKYGEDYAPNSEINRKITVSFSKPNISFNTYKLAIVHITDTTQLVYETEDIKLNVYNEYIISRLDNYSVIILDDIFIKNIAYVKDQVLINYNNRLIRGNVKTIDYRSNNAQMQDFVNNNIKFDVITDHKIVDENERYFKSGELYAPYVALFDKKGDLINIYPQLDNNNKLKTIEIDDINKIVQTHIRPPFGNAPVASPFDTSDCIITNHYNNDDLIVNDIDIIYTSPVSGRSGMRKCMNIINNSQSSININLTLQYELLVDLTFPRGTEPKIGLFEFPQDCDETTIPNELISSICTASGFTDNTYKYKFNLSYNLIIEANSEKQLVVHIWSNYIGDSDSGYHVWNLEGDNTTTIARNIRTYPKITATIIDSSNLPDYVKSVAYLYIEHNTYNSKILSQALCIPDTNIVNFASNQQYEGQFKGKHALRFYPFEYLYNKVSKLKTKVKWKYDIGVMQGSTSNTGNISFPSGTAFHGSLEKTYSVVGWNDEKSETSGFEPDGVKILDCDKKDVKLLYGEINKEILLEYISADNTSQQNIAGDSYYRTKDLTIADYPTSNPSDNEDLYYYNDICIADLLNTAENLYVNSDNQKLQIASSIIPITNREPVELVGDTYLSYLTLRITTPAEAFRYGDAEHTELDSNSTVFRWILTFPIESKYNIAARYSDNIIDKPYFLHNAILQKYVELIGASYKVDNYINTPVGKGYNPVYNENGIENFTYFKDIPGTPDHPHRIIRSEQQNPESISLNWRLFRSDNYKDMPFNRGEIVSLKTDNKNLYIQQQYGLHLLQQRDQLNSDDANQSYLGTSDLFNMEPKEIMYSPSGYIGCKKYSDTNINVSGYVVIDADYKKIFLINGDKPMEISNIKTKEFFNKFISDNADAKRIINYNEDKNLLYISQSNSVINKTMSFSPIHKVWVSFHTYLPDEGFSNRNGLFWIKKGDIFKPISNNNKGLYFNNKANKSIIQFILNENTVYNKLIKTIVWKDVVSQKSENYINYFFDDTINNIMIHNNYQCTGQLKVDGSIANKKWWDGSKGTNKINLWRFNQICDIVLNPRQPFMINAITPNTDNLKTNFKWYDVNKFICQYIYATMWFNNENPSKEWEIIDVNPEYILDNRNDQNYGNQNNNNE